MGNTSTLWPGITNPQALELVRALFNTPGARTDRGDYEQYADALPPGAKQYQAWLRAGLAKSDLARRLAAGLDWLPDFAQELPAPLGFVFRFVQPRSLKDAGSHLVVFLEWYVDPQRAAPIARKASFWAILIGLLLVSLLAILLTLFPVDILSICLVMLGSGSASTGMLVSLLAQGVSSPIKRSINASELYWYFRGEFSE